MLSDIKPVWKQSIELEPYSMEYYYTVSMASTHRYLAYQKRIFFSQQKIAISCNKHSIFMHISFLPTFIKRYLICEMRKGTFLSNVQVRVTPKCLPPYIKINVNLIEDQINKEHLKGFICLDKKKFKKWITQNQNRLLLSKKAIKGINNENECMSSQIGSR